MFSIFVAIAKGISYNNISVVALFILISAPVTFQSSQVLINKNISDSHSEQDLNGTSYPGNPKEIQLAIKREYFESFGFVLIPKTVVYTGEILLAQTTALISFGQPIAYRQGTFRLWSGDIMGPENSQQLTDPYSLTHVVHGFLFYWTLNAGLIPYKFIPFGIETKFLIALALEATWEIIENTPWVIQRYRDTASAQGYTGDSVINSIGDSVAMSVGFWIAHFTPWYVPVLLTIGEEILLGILIRDNLAINIFQLLFSSKTISGWQEKKWNRKAKVEPKTIK